MGDPDVPRPEMRLPDFCIIGAKRSGTTSLSSTLKEHPDVFIGKKEIHYFDYQHDKGDQWYSAHFADARLDQQAGEATQTYLFDPEVPPRMAQLVPEAKLIATLRNPVDRAYSDYSYNKARGIEELSFEDALAAESRRGQTYRMAYLARGFYASQLRRVSEFYPRDQILVIIFEEYIAAPESGFRGVCEFLGIDADITPRLLGRQVNPTVQFRSRRVREFARRRPNLFTNALARVNQKQVGYPEMSPATRATLEERYAEANADLAAWLGRDLDPWRR